jgi:hypothetical protein
MPNYDALMGLQQSKLNSLAEPDDYATDTIIPFPLVLNMIYWAISVVDQTYPIVNKQEFARRMLEQLWIESGQGSKEGIHSCLQSPTGPWGIGQFTKSTWNYVFTLYNWTPLPLSDRCDPAKCILMAVAYMAYLMDRAKGNLRTAARNYNGDKKVSKYSGGKQTRDWYADTILARYNGNFHDYAALEQVFDPTGSMANAMRVEFP